VLLAEYHRQALDRLEQKWQADLKSSGISANAVGSLIRNIPSNSNATAPTARTAGVIAFAKAMVEMPTLNRTAIAESAAATVVDRLNPNQWQTLAAWYRPQVRLHPNSVSLMRRKLNADPQPPRTNLAAMQENFERAIALDTVRNEYLLHSQIHSWFANARETDNLENLNRRVYAELFLTPASDPWLGLVSPDVYTGLPE
jgi:hypothetical protein